MTEFNDISDNSFDDETNDSIKNITFIFSSSNLESEKYLASDFDDDFDEEDDDDFEDLEEDPEEEPSDEEFYEEDFDFDEDDDEDDLFEEDDELFN